jgi:hypothetical protein
MIDVVQCDSAEQLISELRPHSDRLQAIGDLPTWVFRGHSNADWPLTPSSLRKGAFNEIAAMDWPDGLFTIQRDQLAMELKTLIEFIEIVDSIGLPIPDDSMTFREWLEEYPGRLLNSIDKSEGVFWPPRNLLAVVALARHSGLPTRLLDWTTNPLKAAYFAASGAATKRKSSELCIWAIDRARFRKCKRRAGCLFDNNQHLPIEFFSVPRAANPNAHAQDGWFSVVRIEHDLDAEVAISSLDEEVKSRLPSDCPAGVFQKFMLSAAEAPRLLWILAGYGINAATVYPGYAGAAAAFRERCLYPR